MYEHLLTDCPDAERAAKNIASFLAGNPEYEEAVRAHRRAIALLFSHSQFLANYAVRNPEILFRSLGAADIPATADRYRAALRDLLAPCNTPDEGMRAVRAFKKRHLLTITLRDVVRRVEPQEVMLDLSTLADAILSESLRFVETRLIDRYGAAEDNAVAVIGLGKLGAQELNFSSDVDIIFVYRSEGETTGVQAHHGVTRNRVTASEYYIKLAEELTRFVGANTADGFAYRVDLRLRPQGQKGALALSLRSHEEYYESWGQLWERAALLRARPVAGDAALGAAFLEAVRPFVFRKYLDFDAIAEIRRMKDQVEQLRGGTFGSDIKRGYGGIREIEFFIQVFQLMYGGKEALLRERSTLKALHRLLHKGLIGHDDFSQLSGAYLFLRTLEHRLQQVNDIQTHSLPANDRELDILGRKMGFSGRDDFMAELRSRRMRVRAIYDSLFRQREPGERAGTGGDERPGILGGVFWDMETPVEDLLTQELSGSGIRDVRRAIHCLTKLRNTIYSFQTIRGRRLLEDLIPRFVEEALKGGSPDAVLVQLVDFFAILSARESYLEAIAERPWIIANLTFVFSRSEYLSKILMGNPYYVQAFVEEELRERRVNVSRTQLPLLAERYGEPTAIRLLRRLYELRLGVAFLSRRIGIGQLMRSLTCVAEEILSLLMQPRRGVGGFPPGLPQEEFSRRPALSAGHAVIGYGKLGGRELTFNSDLDVTFVTLDEPTLEEIRTAERLLKVLASYTKDGVAYRVDTRLRPEGSKGPLVNSLEGLREYYLSGARPWELQALLKARPVRADREAARRFMEMRREVLTKRGEEVTPSELVKMREKIVRELSRESPDTAAYDIKLGPGGLEEVEFMVQFLQLRNCRESPSLMVQGTREAIHRLRREGVLAQPLAEALGDGYRFYRIAETVLRLKNASLLRRGSDASHDLARFVGTDEEGLFHRLDETRVLVTDIWEHVMCG